MWFSSKYYFYPVLQLKLEIFHSKIEKYRVLRNEIDQILLIVLEWFPDKEHFEDYALKKEVDMLKDKGQLSFEDKWPSMRPTILKLLRQETVTRGEWHDLFWLVHSVCLWDEKGPPKVYSALRDVRFWISILLVI